MGLQQLLNDNAIASLPRIQKLIDDAKSFEANQMYQLALREMMCAWKPIDLMSLSELDEFQDDLIAIFEYHHWM